MSRLTHLAAASGNAPIAMTADANDERVRVVDRILSATGANAAIARSMRERANRSAPSFPPAVQPSLPSPPSTPSPPSSPSSARAGVEVGPVLGFIGLENTFFLLAPYFPHSNGPYADIAAGGRTIHLSWNWEAERTTPGRSGDGDPHGQPPGFLAEWGRVMQRTHTSGGSMELDIPVPCGYTVTTKLPRSERQAEEKWGLIEFRTNASPAPLDPVACPRPNKNKATHRDTAPTAKRAHATVSSSYN